MPETFIGDDFHKEKDTVFRDVLWQGQKGSTLALRCSVIRGSEAPTELHSPPLLLLALIDFCFTKRKNST